MAEVRMRWLVACQLALLVAFLRELARQVKWRQWAISSGIAAFVALMLIQPKFVLFYRLGVDGWGQLNYQVASLQRVLASLAALPASELASVAIAQAGDFPAQGSRRFQIGRLRASEIRPSELRFEVSSAAETFLALGMTWNPYWRAEIDRKPARIVRINHAQMGIEMPAGATSVRLRYVPPYLPF